MAPADPNGAAQWARPLVGSAVLCFPMVVVNKVVGDGNLSLDERVGGADGTLELECMHVF